MIQIQGECVPSAAVAVLSGVCLPRGGVHPGGSLPRWEMSALREVSVQGYAQKWGVSAKGDVQPPVDRQTPIKT